ncbi:MAG: glycosyltransferase family 2 protein [Leadbetterella sp.]
MSNKPKVSVIVPNFNHEAYLDARLASILNQSFTDFEIILLDDASKDKSVDVLTKYTQDIRVSHFVKNEKNSGSTFIQWQKGIELAKGDYIWIAESDDLCHENFLEYAIHDLMNDSKLGLVYYASEWIDSAGVVFDKPNFEDEGGYWSGSEFIQKSFTKGNSIYNASSALFSKDLLKNVDFESLTTYKYTGDWLFWVQMIQNTHIKRRSERYNRFRRHSHNVSFKADDQGLQFMEGFQILRFIFETFRFGFLEKRKIYMSWARRIARKSFAKKADWLRSLPFELRLYHWVFSLV